MSAATGFISMPPPETLGTSREELVDLMAGRQSQSTSSIFNLPDADLGGHRRHRLAGRWRGDHESDPAVPIAPMVPTRAR